MSDNCPASLRHGNFPTNPGVYWFLNQSGKVLYVGKAKNLKNRLLSYRYITKKSEKTFQMLTKAKKVKFQITDSEFEALLVEAELIKLYQPFYNLRLTDNKSPLYIYITSTPFPHVKTGRLKQLNKYKIKKYNRFGPYPSGFKAKQVIKFIRSIFPFCNATEFQIKNKKACFYSHINLCPGACTGKISKPDYLKNINNLKLFLKGKKSSVLKSLNSDLQQASQNEEFEKAIVLRDQIKMIKALADTANRPELNLPDLTQDEQKNKLKALLKILRQHLSLPQNYPLKRIEAYDVSNLEGLNATASMVVFINAKPEPSEYRRFKINNLKSPNDPAMIRQALSRRIKHTDWAKPNLIVIDGGITQLKAALTVVSWNIPVVSIAKHPDRLILQPSGSGPEGQFTRVTLDLENLGTQVIQHLRDESHRFAKNYHLKLRQFHLQG